MDAKQKHQLQGVEEILLAMVAELSPRVIQLTAEKQAELGISEESFLIPIGLRRAITVSTMANGHWLVKEFDTSASTLVPVWEESGDLGYGLLVSVVLGAAIGSLEEQLAFIGSDTVPQEERGQMEQMLALLRARHTTLLEEGIESFEFEPILPELISN
jgi:hypothetical protein